MRPDDWHLTDDVEDFLARAGGFLRSRPALHNTALTDIEKLRAPGTGASLLGRLEADGEVRAVFYLTPRGRLGLTPLSAERTDVLAARLAGLGHSPPRSSRTTTPPVPSPRRGSGTAAPHRRRSGGRTSTVSARSPRRGRPRRGAVAARERATMSTWCAGAASSAWRSVNGRPSS